MRKPMVFRSAGMAALICGAAIAAIHVSVWLFLPSNNIHSDALDELMLIESAPMPVSPKHPAAEPAVWALMRALRSAGYKGDSIRPTQIWNGAWMTLALLALQLFAWRASRSVLLAFGLTLTVGACHAAVHLAVDPFAFYWPPSLALMTLGLALCLPSAGRGAVELAREDDDARGAHWIAWGAALLLLTASSLFNPMCAIALPLAALLWALRIGVARARLAASQALALVAAPAIALLWARAWAHASDAAAGPYGAWTPTTLRDGWNGLMAALIARAEGQQAWGALRGQLDFASIATTAAVALCLLAAALAAIHLAANWRRALRLLAWLAAAATASCFILWWDPAQTQFWLLPIWLLALGAADAWRRPAPKTPEKPGMTPARPLALAAALAVCVLGAALCAANGAGYVWPAATNPNAQKSAAERFAARFKANDLIVFRVFPELNIDYYGKLRTYSMLAIFAARKPGQSSFESLEEILRYVHERGGAVYLEVPNSGESWIPSYVRERTQVDYADADFARVRWGRTIEVDGRVFREALAVESSTSAVASPLPQGALQPAPGRPIRD